MKTNNNFLLFDNHVEFGTWLQTQKITRKITLIQNHHTWVPNYSHFNGSNHFERLEAMRNSHMQGRGFVDIAQQLTTFPDGKIGYSKGRPFNLAPAGITGANSNGICIENLGDFDLGGDTMTELHKQTILHLNLLLVEKLNLPIDTEHIVYHHWFATSGKRAYDFKSGVKVSGIIPAKTCPGTNFFGGNTVIDAQKYFIPVIKALKEEDQPMTDAEKKAFETLQEKVKEQAELISALTNSKDFMKEWLTDVDGRVKTVEKKQKMSIPSYAKEAVDAAVKAKLIDTPDNGSEDFYRLLTVLHRKGII